MAEMIPDSMGRLRVVVIPDPAIAAQFSYNQEIHTRWRVISVRCSLACDVNAANRVGALTIESGANPVLRSPLDSNMTANQTWTLCWFAGVNEGSNASVLTQNGMLPIGLMMNNQMTIRSSFANMQVGDKLEGITVLVEEWIEPLA